jgi:hypothetical protein
VETVTGLFTYSEGYYTAEGGLVDDADVEVWADVDETPGIERVLICASNRDGFEAQLHLRDGDAEHLVKQLQTAIEEMRLLKVERAAPDRRCGVIE